MINKVIKNISPVLIKNPVKVDLYSPWNQKKIAKIECIKKGDVNKILEVSYNFFKNKSLYIEKKDRIKILKKAGNLLTKKSNHFSKLIALEGGKPLKDSKVEVQRAISGLELCIDSLKKCHGIEIPMGLNDASMKKMAFTKKFPVGPVFAVSAFNHPLNLIIHQVGPAIAAGCPIIIKPALDTPATCFEFINLLLDAGLPNGFCQMINVNDHSVTQSFLKDERISFFSFIGSSKVGWKLKSMVSPGTGCALEHGGIASVIIDKGTNIKKILPMIVRGAFYHAGQVCVSIQKVIVHKDILDEFIVQIKASLQKVKVGDPLKRDTDVGPLIRPNELKRVDSLVKNSIKNGAELVCGGKAISKSTYECTVIKNPKQSSEINKVEIFGPVLCVYGYKNIDDAIEKANHNLFAFQSSIFTNNLDTAMESFEKLDAKSVFINEQTAFRVDWMPFGGIKHSGESVGGIDYTFSDLMYDKLIVINSEKITT
tara:strand:- start:144 stop:1592 length:1449 start_codon:yes stop_codon:yes gene_type:complete